MPAKYTVRLSDEQRDHLDHLTRSGTRHARLLGEQHARILLLAEEADAEAPRRPPRA